MSHRAQASTIRAAFASRVRKCAFGALPAESNDVFDFLARSGGMLFITIHALHAIHSLRGDFDRDL
jgi:hypothetical protein